MGRNSEIRAFAEGADRNAGAEDISQDMGHKQGRRRDSLVDMVIAQLIVYRSE